MPRKLVAHLARTALLGAAFVSGCSSSSHLDDSAGSALTPTAVTNMFDQAAVCDGIFDSRAAFREVELQQGILRWGCGDVPGVTPDVNLHKGLGEEYCEYHATLGGQIADAQAAEALADGAAMSCVFNSVFFDADSSLAATVRDGLADARLGNLGGAATVDPALGQMQITFNARAAASGLIAACAAAASEGPSARQAIVASRAAACFQAAQLATDPASRQALGDACRAASAVDASGMLSTADDLSADATFARASSLAQAANSPIKMASSSDASDEGQRQLDLAACVRTAEGNGQSWRNSDSSLCSRTMRATGECGDTLGSIAASVTGFALTGLANEELPAGCRHAKLWTDASGNPVDSVQVKQASIDAKAVSAQDFAEVIICDADPDDVQVADGTLQQFCEEKFAANIGVLASIKPLVARPHPSAATPFCSEFNAGIDAP